MLRPFRSDFNARQFSEERFAELVAVLDRRTRTKVSFPICETPCFFSVELMDEISRIGIELTHQLIDSPKYMRLSDEAIPAKYRVANDNPRPNLMTVDFGLTRDEDGRLQPKLVELQAFPSILGYQDVLCEEYQRVYGLDESLGWHLGGLDRSSYWDLVRRTVVGDHDPENVVLTEVQPELQKTLPTTPYV